MNLWKRITAFLMVLLLLASAPAAYARQTEEPDVDKLQELLEMAEGMQQYDYTAESWHALRKAVAVANAAIGSGKQAAIDSAVGQLASALSKMVEIDYSEMDAVMAQVEQFLEEDGTQWQQLLAALVQVQAARQSGDQILVDSAAATLADSLRACQAAHENKKGSASVIWIVLLGVSLLGNAAFVVQFVWKKKDNRRKQIDDVPLVDYDIDDDLI